MGDKKSHREDLVCDLISVGIEKDKILFSQPSRETLKTIDRTFKLFKKDNTSKHHQIRVITIIRFWGEVLVAKEYSLLWDRLVELGLEDDGKYSCFYKPHILHDEKVRPLTNINGITAMNHADKLSIILLKYLDDVDTFTHCKNISSEIISIKTDFYSQFIE